LSVGKLLSLRKKAAGKESEKRKMLKEDSRWEERSGLLPFQHGK